jgi:hypothetical protein
LFGRHWASSSSGSSSSSSTHRHTSMHVAHAAHNPAGPGSLMDTAQHGVMLR